MWWRLDGTWPRLWRHCESRSPSYVEPIGTPFWKLPRESGERGSDWYRVDYNTTPWNRVAWTHTHTHHQHFQADYWLLDIAHLCWWQWWRPPTPMLIPTNFLEMKNKTNHSPPLSSVMWFFPINAGTHNWGSLSSGLKYHFHVSDCNVMKRMRGR